VSGSLPTGTPTLLMRYRRRAASVVATSLSAAVCWRWCIRRSGRGIRSLR